MLDDIVNGSQAHVVVIEHGIQNIEYTAKGAVTDQDHRQNELMNPGLGNRQIEQDLLVMFKIEIKYLSYKLKHVVVWGYLIIDLNI